MPVIQTTLPPYLLGVRSNLHSVYGYWVHQYTGTSLKVGTSNDPIWKLWVFSLVALTVCREYIPNGTICKRFLPCLAAEIHGVGNRWYNSDWLIPFPIIYLHKTWCVKVLDDVHRTLTHVLVTGIRKMFMPWHTMMNAMQYPTSPMSGRGE